MQFVRGAFAVQFAHSPFWGVYSLDTLYYRPSLLVTVTITAADAAGNTNTCTFDVTVEDHEAPRAACRQGVNPSGKNIPIAGKNPNSGQNPDGFYQLLAKDNCDANPAIYVADTGSTFVAGPFQSGDVIKLTQSPGRTPSQDPAPAPIVAHVHLKGDGAAILMASSRACSQLSRGSTVVR